MQILTGLAGMMVSRPKCMTSWKTYHFSSQLTKGVNNRGQFICVRYLPNVALLLIHGTVIGISQFVKVPVD